MQDGLGSVRLQADADLAVDGAQHFAPYGVPFGELGSFDAPFGFTGEQTDGNSQVYLRARHYNPDMGVFGSLDAVEGALQETLSLNRYGYVAGDPVNRIDPSGNVFENPYVFDLCGPPAQTGRDCSCHTNDFMRRLCEQGFLGFDCNTIISPVIPPEGPTAVPTYSQPDTATPSATTTENPTATQTPTNTATAPSPVIPEGRCSIIVGQPKQAYSSPQSVTSGIASIIIPEGTYLTVFGRWGGGNLIVQVQYQGQYLWLDSSSGVSQAAGNCQSLPLIPEVDPATFCIPSSEESCVDIYLDTPQTILAHVIYTEANSLDTAGMANVAQVIRNRQGYEGRSNILSVVMAEDARVNSNQRYTFVGLAEPANRTTLLWNSAMVLAQQLLDGLPLTPSANLNVQQSDVIYYCATNSIVANTAPSVHIDTNVTDGIYQIYRTVSQGPCQ